MNDSVSHRAWIERVWVVIAVHNRLALTRQCLHSLRRQTTGMPNALVVDDGSTDGTRAALNREFPEVTVIATTGDAWWTAATNLGIRRALEHDADWVLLANNDTTFAPDCLAHLHEAARRCPGSLVGCVSRDIADGTLLYAGTRLNWWPGRFEVAVQGDEDFAEVTHLPGRGMLVPAAVFDELGLFDTRFPQRFADYDFSHRAYMAGWEVRVCLRAHLRMHGPETSSGAEYRARPSLGRLIRHLTAINGPANLRYFSLWAWRHCPRPKLIPYVIWGISARIGGYLRDWLHFHHRRRLRT